MDFTAVLPAPAAAGNRGCTPRGAGDNDTRDSRVEESGALSFPGLLEQSRESVPKDESRSPEESETADGAKDPVQPGNVASLEDGAKPASPAPDGKSVPMEINQGNVLPGIGQMIKVQMAVQGLETAPTTGAAPLARDLPGQVGEVAGMDHPALPDYQPTGGDGQATPAIALPESSGESGQEAPTGASTPRLEAVSTEVEIPGQGKIPVVKGGPSREGAPAGNEPEAPAGRQTMPAMADKLVASGSIRTPVDLKTKRTEVPADDQAHPAPAGTVASEMGTSESAPVPRDPGEETPAEPDNPTVADMSAAVETGKEETQETSSAGENAPVVMDAKPAEAASKPAPLEKAVPDLEKPGTGMRATGKGGHSFGRVDTAGHGHGIREQVLQQLSSTLDGKVGNEKVTLQLNPENLGRVEISFNAGGNDLDIVITTDNHEAEQAIREGIRELAEGIAAKSGRWQQVDIRVDQRSQDPGKNESRQDGRREQGRRDESGQRQHHQQQRDQSRGGAPDWASLRGEG